MLALDNFENWVDESTEYKLIQLFRILKPKSTSREITDEEYDIDRYLYNDGESDI